ncbi:MAG: PAS domain S-box protein, partial [Candidatus Riflebacteria bacterium]|nr:PAS domain S-box protein [Candidatus Riflebacteria bacterium]
MTSDLQERLRYESAVAAFAGRLFAGTGDEHTLTAALAPLIEAFDVSRVYVFRNDQLPGLGLCCSQLAEACAAGVEPQIDNPALQNTRYDQACPRWRDLLAGGRPVLGPVRGFPPEEREVLEPQGIVSLAVVPVFGAGRWLGFLGLDDCCRERSWPDWDLKLLEVLAGIVGSFLAFRAEARSLSENEAKYRALFESSAEAVFLIGDVIEDCNAQACRLLGKDQDSIVGRPAVEFTQGTQPDGQPSAAVVSSRLREAFEGRSQLFKFTHVLPDGRPAILEVSLTPVQISGRLLALAVIRDLSERLEAEQERRRMEQRLQHTQRLESLGVLAGGIAHDFNNLLTVILGNAGLAAEELPPRHASRAYLAQIEQASLRAADLCRQMLAFAGKGKYVVRPLELGSVTREMTHLLQGAIGTKATLE